MAIESTERQFLSFFLFFFFSFFPDFFPAYRLPNSRQPIYPHKYIHLSTFLELNSITRVCIIYAPFVSNARKRYSVRANEQTNKKNSSNINQYINVNDFLNGKQTSLLRLLRYCSAHCLICTMRTCLMGSH